MLPLVCLVSSLRFRYAMPGPVVLRAIGSRPCSCCAPPPCPLPTPVPSGHALLLMSIAVAVLGSVVFVQNTWF
jgi:hypothetical protein